MTTDASNAMSLYTKDWPTGSLGWMVAYCARRLQEGLARSFASAGYKVSPEQWSIVAHLWEHDGLSQQALADHFHRSKVSAFHLITKLEGQGIIARRPNPDDGRSNLIHLTEQGRAMAEKLIPLAQGNLDRAVEGIPSADVEKARAVLYKIAINMTP